MVTTYERLADGSISATSLFDDRYKRVEQELFNPNPMDRRTGSERDRGRVVYSGYFQRLAGVTQIVSPTLRHGRMHNRLTHSQKVGLVAREIASDLLRFAESCDTNCSDSTSPFAEVCLSDIAVTGGLDLASCELAGLAHDIGHAPFGHNAEKFLDSWICEHDASVDGFEGNAQSLRVVGLLEQHVPGSSSGLNMSAVALAALQKYPWLRDRADSQKADKFSVYTSDFHLLSLAREAMPHEFRETEVVSLEAAIMDVADDITYALHDLQDFYLVGLISVDQVVDHLRHIHSQFSRPEFVLPKLKDLPAGSDAFLRGAALLQEKNPSIFNLARYTKALSKVRIGLKGRLDGPFDGSPLMSASVRAAFSLMIKDIMKNLRFSRDPSYRPFVFIDDDAWHEVQVLKHIAQGWVVDSPLVALHERSQLATLKVLLEELEDWASSANRLAKLPQPLYAYVVELESREKGSPSLRRAVCDYVCSLTDAECVQLAKHLSGAEAPWLARQF